MNSIVVQFKWQLKNESYEFNNQKKWNLWEQLGPFSSCEEAYQMLNKANNGWYITNMVAPTSFGVYVYDNTYSNFPDSNIFLTIRFYDEINKRVLMLNHPSESLWESPWAVGLLGAMV